MYISVRLWTVIILACALLMTGAAVMADARAPDQPDLPDSVSTFIAYDIHGQPHVILISVGGGLLCLDCCCDDPCVVEADELLDVTPTDVPDDDPIREPKHTPKPKPGPTKTPKPTDPPDPTKEPRPTKTPKPTDEPRPTKTPKPTKMPKPTDPPDPTLPPPPPTWTPPPPPTPTPEWGGGCLCHKKVKAKGVVCWLTKCFKPNQRSAYDAHLAHGDSVGSCPTDKEGCKDTPGP